MSSIFNVYFATGSFPLATSSILGLPQHTTRGNRPVCVSHVGAELQGRSSMTKRDRPSCCQPGSPYMISRPTLTQRAQLRPPASARCEARACFARGGHCIGTKFRLEVLSRRFANHREALRQQFRRRLLPRWLRCPLSSSRIRASVCWCAAPLIIVPWPGVRAPISDLRCCSLNVRVC